MVFSDALRSDSVAPRRHPSDPETIVEALPVPLPLPHRRRWLVAALCAALSSAVAPSASGTTLVARPLDVMVREADAVAVITTSAAPVRTARWVDGRIVTRVEVTVVETLRGSLAPGSLTLSLPGGTIGGITQHLPGAPDFGPGGAWVVLLRRTAAGEFTVAGLCLGQLPVTLDPVTHLAMVRPASTEGVTLIADPRTPAPVVGAVLGEVPSGGVRLETFAALVRAMPR